MEFNYAFNKPNSFFKDKAAMVVNDLTNGHGEIIFAGTEIAIIGKSEGMKVYFNIVAKTGILMYNVSYENLEIIKINSKLQ